MNKSELVDRIASATDTSKADAAASLDATVDAIVEAVAAGDTVKIPGFGNFDVRENAARKGRNPATGEEMDIAASKTPRFKPLGKFKDAVNS